MKHEKDSKKRGHDVSLLNTFGELKRRICRDGDPLEHQSAQAESGSRNLADDLQRAPKKATMKRQFNGVPVWTIE